MKVDGPTQKDRKYITAAHIAENYALKEDIRISVKHFIDWGEPCCWACGYYDINKVKETDYKSSDQNVFSCWNRAAYLEKCHIIPHSISGDNTAGNFVLMCKKCHRDSPDTSSYEAFQVWFDNREHWMNSVHKEYKYYTDIYRLDLEKTAKYILSEDGCSFNESFSEFLGNNAVMVAGHFSPSSIVAAISSYLNDNNLEDKHDYIKEL